MKKVVVWQSPAFLYEVVPPFYQELNKLNYFDQFYLATDQREPYGLGDNVSVISLTRDFGWEGNLERLLSQVAEPLVVMMCDDHVTVSQTELDLDVYFELMEQDLTLGRLQLSPPTRNYYLFLKSRGLPVVIPDDSRSWYPYDKRYRWHLNFQPSIWRVDFLREVIRGGGNKSQLEIRASERARKHSGYLSGYISDYALKYENFYASCQVHHTDPLFDVKNKVPHYREEFVKYALSHGITLDPKKRVHVRRSPRGASVPLDYYLKHHDNVTALRKYEIRTSALGHRLSKFSRRVRARVAPRISWSGK